MAAYTTGGNVTTFTYNQSNFSGGELTPLMRARTDNDIYYKSLKFARNILTIPQGGFRRRFGTDYVSSIPVTSFEQVVLGYFNFDENSQYLLVIIPYSILIYKNDTLVASVITPYSDSEIPNIRFDQQLNFMVFAHSNHPPQQLTRGGNDSAWTFQNFIFKNLPVFDFLNNYDGITFTLGALTGSNITLTASSAIFTTENVNGTFTAIPGFAKIISYTSPTSVQVNIVIDFTKASFTGAQSILTEPAFSATRGWPAAVSFYQQRLAFASTASLKNGLFFSEINNLQEFMETFGQNTDALFFLIAGTQNEVEYLVNAVSLFAFTQGGAYATPPLTEAAFTASTARINRITSNGIKNNVQPIFGDNQIFFLDRGGANLISLQYDITTGGYKEKPKGFTAKTLIRQPIDMDKLEFDPLTQSNYIFLCNIDGTLTIHETMKEENINSWTLHDTQNGEFGRVANVNDDIYFVIKRLIGSQEVFYIEKKNNTSVFDCSTTIHNDSPASSIDGLAYLNGQTVSVKADGVYLGDDFLVNESKINLGDSYTDVEIGYNFIPTATLLPINMQSQTGDTLYRERLINTVTLNVFETYGIEINGEDLHGYMISEYDAGDTPSLFTGFVQVPLGQSLASTQEITITQNLPYNMSIIGVGQEFELGG